MSDYLLFLLLGLGSGAVFAALGMSLVVTYRSSGVVNFSTGAVALYCAYTYAYLRQGELLDPIPGLPVTAHLGPAMGFAPAMGLTIVVAAVLGLLLYAAVFRPMRSASMVAKVVASIGLMLVIQGDLALRVGTNPVSVDPILTRQSYTIGTLRVPGDRLWFAGIIVVMAVVLGAYVRYTRFGLATRAVAETERGAILSGLSPDRIAAINWSLSTVVAGISGVLIAPIVPLVPLSYTLFIVPALAAAMVGGFSRLGPTVLAGLLIGMVQSVLTYVQNTVSWFPASGVPELVVLLLILALLILRRDPLPRRGAVAAPSLGHAPRPKSLIVPGTVVAVLGVGTTLLTHGNARDSIVTTVILAVIGLSQVVVTGFAGQVSLAQLAVAGTAAFSLSRFSTQLHIPFPIAPLLAALVATVIGVVVGLPALRLRGLPVAVVTLAMAVTLQAIWFQNIDLNGGGAGAPVADPHLFGLDLGPGSGRAYPRIAFGVMCLVILLLVALGVSALRRSRLGASMLAVRANERSAAASGIDVSRVKVIAFAISSFIAGTGGALIAYQQGGASTQSFTALASVGIFATAYLAGISSVGGGINAGIIGSGGVLYLLMSRYLHLNSYFTTVSALLLVITVIRHPDGVMGLFYERLARWRDGSGKVAELRVAEEERTGSGEAPEFGEDVLTADEVGVRYGGVVALADVSFSVRRGEILGLIGPNGAGKTTLIDALSGYSRYSGTVTLHGQQLDGLRPHRRSRLGLGRTFQAAELYDDLTVRENVLVGTNSAKDRKTAEAVLDQMFEVLHLTELSERRVAELSQGQRQLVSVARTLAGRPAVVLLDEPAAGLDSTESKWLGNRVRGIRRSGVTVVMVDHDMSLVLDVCDRIVVLDLGRVIASGTPAEIQADPEVIRAYLGGSTGAQDAAAQEPALAVPTAGTGAQHERTAAL